MKLAEARRTAQEAIRTVEPAAEVTAVTSEGGAAYTELIVVLDDCVQSPCTLMIGADRTASQEDFRNAVLEGFRRHRESA
jgi:hypothetical protein